MRWRTGILTLLLMVGTTGICLADDAEGAKRAFEEGVELEKRGDYPTALAKFRTAEQLKATAGVRFHVAYCLEMLGNIASALETYEAAEKLAREQGKTEVESAARTRLEPLRPRVPEITIRSSSPAPSGARVELDGAPARLNEPVRVDPGDHAVVATAPGYYRLSRRLTVAEGARSTVDLTFVRENATAPEETTTLPSSEPARKPRTLAIATSAGAVVLLAAGVVSLVLAGNAADDARAECPTKTSCTGERSTVRTLDTIALAGFASGLVLGGVSVYLWTSSGTSTVAIGGAF